MGLMDGLSHWLRQIIAVILLASLIDLMLPNRTMQRYVRLVAGLFILMTVATPIMHWMKGDFTNKLAAGLDAVELAPQGASDQLAMIEAEGAKLRDKQDAQAANLVTARMESSIRSEVEQSEHRGVRKVDVVLKQGEDGSLSVASVSILLEPEQKVAVSGSESLPVKEVEPIAAVDIQIRVDSWPKNNQEAAPATSEAKDIPASATEQNSDRETGLRISALVAGRFGLPASIVEVKFPSTDKTNKN